MINMKQYLLKGKDFLMKKLDEMEIPRQQIDYVAEQIPKRLHQKLKLLEAVDFDLESAANYAPYFRTYPNHCITPLLAQRVAALQPQKDFVLKESLLSHSQNIPEFDAGLEMKAKALKKVVDSYEQAVPNINQKSDHLICICVVHFHHKRGTEVEYRYPFNETVERIEEKIVNSAMPDSSHNKGEDYNFFNFMCEIDGKPTMLFGVSYFKQVRVTESMKARNEELTRSHLQKAVCIVSRLPLFGYLKIRLALTTKMFFEDFTNFEAVKQAFQDISKHLVETAPKIDVSQLYTGTDLRQICKIFGYKLFEIYKSILYQRRIVVFSHSSSSSSAFILSLLSLFPGLLTFGMRSGPIDRYLQGLRQYALPLKLFSVENPLILSFHIQDFDLISRFKKMPRTGNYLIGTTNRLVKESKNYGIQLIVNLEDCSIENLHNDDDSGIWEGVTKQQKQFVDQILGVLEMDYTCGYEGSEDWIRDKFHSYLKDKLVEFVDAKHKYLKFIADCKEYSQKYGRRRKNSSQNKNYAALHEEEESGQKTKQVEVPEIPQAVLNIPLSGLLEKSQFSYFLQFHNPRLHLLSQKYPTNSLLTVDNYDYYMGKIPKFSGQYINYNQKARRLRYGNPEMTGKRIKELRFDQEDNIVQVYVGDIQNGKYNGQGFLLTENELYEGEFQNNFRHGFGKLYTPVQNYIGNLHQGLYHGQGQLLTLSNNHLYVGNFKDGLKDGQGRLQTPDFLYDGEFLQNEMWGNGEILLEREQARVLGEFRKGKIAQGCQCVIKYNDGDTYAGHVNEEFQPEGKGTLRKVNGEIVEGIFRAGVLL